MSMMKIGVVGLGYVGLPVALAFAKKYKTFGFDIDERRVGDLKNYRDSTLEFTEDELRKVIDIHFTNNLEDLRDCNIFIVTVPTPVDKFNVPDLTAIKTATHCVAKLIKKNDIVIYESTTYPGATEEVCVPILEAESKLIFNTDFFCGYSPERINPGDPENKFTNLVKITSGSTHEAAKIVNDLYSSVVEAGTYLAPSIKVAEAAKVIENAQRDLNIAFVNELSLLFDKMDIDTQDVLSAAGSKWNFLPFKPGLVGGHCIGVDPFYLSYKAAEVGYHCEIVQAARRINDSMPQKTAERIARKLTSIRGGCYNAKVGILGITFKENCPDIRNSKTFELIEELIKWGLQVSVSDPYYDCKKLKDFGLEPLSLSSEGQLDAIVITIGHNEYRSFTPDQLIRMLKKKQTGLVADLKGLYDKNHLVRGGVDVIRL